MLKNIIEKDYLEAYRAKENFEVSVLRMLKSAIKNIEIAEKQELSDSEVIHLLKKEIKQRRDTIETYKKAGKADAASNEQKEIDIISRYLPAQKSEEETRSIVETAIKELSITEMNQIGRLIGAVLGKYGDSVDASLVSKIARESIQNK